MLGIERDIQPFYLLAECDPCLDVLAERFKGMPPPRFASVLEALVNAVACQQLSLDVGVHLMNRLAGLFGPRRRVPTRRAAWIDVGRLSWSARDRRLPVFGRQSSWPSTAARTRHPWSTAPILASGTPAPMSREELDAGRHYGRMVTCPDVWSTLPAEEHLAPRPPGAGILPVRERREARSTK